MLVPLSGPATCCGWNAGVPAPTAKPDSTPWFVTAKPEQTSTISARRLRNVFITDFLSGGSGCCPHSIIYGTEAGKLTSGRRLS